MDHSPSSATHGNTDEPTDLTGSTKTGRPNDDRALEVPPYALNYHPEHWP